MSLPKNEAQFSFDEIGEVTQQQFVGEFTCVCVPTIALKNQISREEMRVMGDPVLAPSDLQLRGMCLANLRFRIIDGPTWWKESDGGNALLDENIPLSLYKKVLEAETSWREEVKKKADDRKAGTSPNP
jgi:hypothetical protein